MWSETIAWRVVRALPDAALVAAWGGGADDAAALAGLRRELVEASAGDAELRAWLWARWRAAEAELVEALERRLAGLDAGTLDELQRERGPEALLLAALSDPHAALHELPEGLEERLGHPRDRRALRAAWAALAPPPPAAPPLVGRLVVIGGHPRERERLGALLAACAGTVKWIPATKGAGLGAAQRALDGLSTADRVVIVTGRVSHSVMYSARDACDRLGVGCHFLEQVSERHVERLLAELRAEGAG